jgi:hypothetical protein
LGLDWRRGNCTGPHEGAVIEFCDESNANLLDSTQNTCELQPFGPVKEEKTNENYTECWVTSRAEGVTPFCVASPVLGLGQPNGRDGDGEEV